LPLASAALLGLFGGVLTFRRFVAAMVARDVFARRYFKVDRASREFHAAIAALVRRGLMVVGPTGGFYRTLEGDVVFLALKQLHAEMPPPQFASLCSSLYTQRTGRFAP
jgi:hypothetical protein